MGLYLVKICPGIYQGLNRCWLGTFLPDSLHWYPSDCCLLHFIWVLVTSSLSYILLLSLLLFCAQFFLVRKWEILYRPCVPTEGPFPSYFIIYHISLHLIGSKGDQHQSKWKQGVITINKTCGLSIFMIINLYYTWKNNWWFPKYASCNFIRFFWLLSNANKINVLKVKTEEVFWHFQLPLNAEPQNAVKLLWISVH